MSVDTAFPQIVGDSALADIAQRLAIRATKAVISGSQNFGAAGSGRGYGIINLDDPSLKGDAWRSKVLVPSAYKETPELFYGPFLQLGTYLKGEGVIDSDATAFAMDMVLDPINLASFGTLGLSGKLTGGIMSGLTKAGRWARLMSAIGEGGKITDGAVLFDKMEKTLEAAGKLSGIGDQLLEAAKAGDKRQLGSLIKEALTSGKLADEDAAMLAGMRKDKDLLINVFNKSEDFRKLTLKEGDFLQSTIAGRLAAGQVNPLLKIAVPDISNPLRFTTQLMGLEFHGENFLFPMSKRMAAGLDAVGGETLARSAATAGVPHIVPELDLTVQGAVTKDIEKEFRAATTKSGDLAGWQVASNMSAYKVIVGAPTDRVLATTAEFYGDPDELAKKLQAGFREARQLKPKQDIDPHDFQKYVQSIMDGTAAIRSDADKSLLARRDALIASAMDEAKTVLDQAVATQKIDQATADAHASQLRRMVDLFSTKMISWEATSPGNAMAARRATGRLLARNINAGVRELIFNDYSGRAARNAIGEMFGHAISHPEMFTLTDGAMVLSASRDEIAEGAPMLADTLKRYGARFGEDKLNALMRERGLTADVTTAVTSASELLKAVGQNFFEWEGILDRTVQDYFPRVFHPNNKFFSTMKARGIDVSWLDPRGISQDVEGDVIGKLFDQLDMQAIRSKQAEGTLTFAEARKFTEQQALEFEKQGLGKYEKDGVKLFTAYLDAANGAQLMTRVVRDLPQISGALTYAELIARFGQKWLDQNGIKPGDVEGLRRVMRTDAVPDKMKAVYEMLTTQPRRLLPTDTPEAVLAMAQAKAASSMLAQNVVADARAKVAAKLEGLSKVGGVELVTSKELMGVKLKPEWIRQDSFPAWLRGRERLPVEEVQQAVAGEGPLEGLRWKNPKAGASKTPPKAYRLLSPRDVRLKVNELVNDEIVKATRRAGVYQGKLAEQATKTAQTSAVSVYKADFGHLQEAFGLYKRSRDPNGALDRFFRKYDQWNYALKSFVLLGDSFHFNQLAFSQVLTNPMALGANFVEDATRLFKAHEFNLRNVAVATGVGAAGGTVIGALESDDPEKIAASALVGGVYGLAISSALKNARQAAANFMNPESLDTLMMMGVGGWSGRPDDRAIGVLNTAMRNLAERFARDPARVGFVHPIDGVANALDWWDHLLWTDLHNGSKHYYFSVQWGRELPRLEATKAYKEADDAGKWLMKADLSRQIVQSGNTFFGGQTFRFLLDDPGYVQVARRFFLSPDWTAGRMAVAADYFMNMGPVKAELMGAGLGTLVDYAQSGGDVNKMSLRGPLLGAGLGFALRKWSGNIQRRMFTQGDVMAREARRMAAAALIGGYTMAAALNYAFTGHPIWENEEGRRTQVQLPDGTHVALGKAWVEPFEFAGIYDPERYPIPVVSRGVSKGAVLPVQALRILTNTSQFGGPLVVGKNGPFEMAKIGAELVVDAGTPILLQGPLRAGLDAATGEFRPPALAHAAFRSLGFQVNKAPQLPRMDLSAITRGTQIPNLGNPGQLYYGDSR